MIPSHCLQCTHPFIPAKLLILFHTHNFHACLSTFAHTVPLLGWSFPSFPPGEYWVINPKPQRLVLCRALFDCPGSSSLLLWLPQNFCQTLTGILSLVPYVLTNVSPPMTCSRIRKGALFVLIFSVPIPVFYWQQFHLTCRGHFSMSRDIFVVTVGGRGGLRASSG